jgi:putative transposase
MTDYCRAHISGATWFFTVNLAERRGNRLLVEHIDALRAAFETVRARHPFRMDAVAILPEHLHCILTLPAGDADFSTRWGLIKGCFSRAVERGERISSSRARRGESP